MQFKGSGIVTIESRMSPFYNGATGGGFAFSPNNPFNCKGNEPLEYFNRVEGSDLHYRQTWRLYDCDSGTFQLVTGPQAYYGALWAYDQWPQTNTATFEWEPLDPTPSTIASRPDQGGAPRDNKHTKFLPEPDCRIGLPQYSVNTSFLNLVIEDTDFGCQSFGHDASLRRVWNMRPSIAGMFGNGWSFEYESTIRVAANAVGIAELALGSGQRVDYSVVKRSDGGMGTALVELERSSAGLGPALSASISSASGKGTYLLDDKHAKLSRFYEFAREQSGAHLYRLTEIYDRNDNKLRVTYDAGGRIERLTDASGRETRFGYDANNRCTSMQTFDGRSASYQYDAAGNLSQSIDLAGNVIRYTYDAQNFPLSMTVAGKTTTFAYANDARGDRYVASVTEPDGKTRSYTVGTYGGSYATELGGGSYTYGYGNSYGRTTLVTNPLNQATQAAYNAQLLPASFTDPLGRTTTFDYDANGNLTKVTDSAGQVSTYTYDANWNRTGATNALGQKTTYAYDANSNLISVTSPLGRITTYTVDGKGDVTRITGPDGKFSALTYDSHGNVTGITDPVGRTSRIAFDAQGLNPASVTDGLGHVTGFTFDANRRLTAISLADSTQIQYQRDCCSLTSVRDGAGNVTQFQRDDLYNVTGVTDPLGKQTLFAYNTVRDLVSVTDPLGRVTKRAYDAAHQPSGLTNALGGSIGFQLDASGSLVKLTDEGGKATTMTYDPRGLPASIKDPLGKTTASYVRDALGRVASVANARGNTVALTFDADGRVTGKSYNGTAVATYTWDIADNLTKVSDAAGTRTFTYDAARGVTGIGYPDGKTAAISYDAAGNVLAMTYGDGLTVNYTYDARNRVTGVGFAGNSLTLAYDAAGHRVGETRSNGVASTYGYDAAGRLTGIAHKKGASVIADLGYTRNAAGLITEENGTWPLVPTLAPATDAATYDDANELVNWGSANATHDADGNLIALSDARGFSAIYDPENRPTSITRSGSTTTYIYDGLGQRVQAQSDPITRRFYHDADGRLLFDRDITNAVTTHYIYAGGRLVASGSSTAGYVFYHFDKTGSTLALTSSTGNVAATFAYDPYGKVVARSGSVSTPFTYVGAYGVIEGAGDLFFMQNRYYDAVTGRFIQRDPIGFAGGQSNLYAYVGNNPVTRIDPRGLSGSGGGELGTERPDWLLGDHPAEHRELLDAYLGKNNLLRQNDTRGPDAGEPANGAIDGSRIVLRYIEFAGTVAFDADVPEFDPEGVLQEAAGFSDKQLAEFRNNGGTVGQLVRIARLMTLFRIYRDQLKSSQRISDAMKCTDPKRFKLGPAPF